MKIFLFVIMLTIQLPLLSQEPTKIETVNFLKSKLQINLQDCGTSSMGYDNSSNTGLRYFEYDDLHNWFTIVRKRDFPDYDNRNIINHWDIKFILQISDIKDIQILDQESYFRLKFAFKGKSVVKSIYKNSSIDSNLGDTSFEMTFDYDKVTVERIYKAFRHLCKLCGNPLQDDNLFK